MKKFINYRELFSKSSLLNKSNRLTRRKQAFSLAEISIAMIVIGLIMGAVFMTQSFINAAKRQNIIDEKESYILAFNRFYDTYGLFPGDMPIDKIGGALTNSYNMASFTHNKMTDGAEMGDWLLDGTYSPRVAFRQLYLSGVIAGQAIDIESDINLGDSNQMKMSNSAGVTLPKAKFSNAGVWYITTSSKAHGGSNLLTLEVREHEIFSKLWKNRLVIILTGYKDVETWEPRNNQALGILSPTMAYEISLKIANGMPEDPNSTMIAANGAPNTQYCISNSILTQSLASNATSTTNNGNGNGNGNGNASANVDYTKAKFRSETTSMTKNQCVVGFAIN